MKRGIHVKDLKERGLTVDAKGRLVSTKARKPRRPSKPPTWEELALATTVVAHGFMGPVRIYGEKNVHESPFVKARWTKSYRRYALECMRFFFCYWAGKGETYWRTASTVVVTITRIAPRRLDSGDNLNHGCSAIRDGIADSFGVPDNDTRFVWKYEDVKGKPREYGLIVTLVGFER